MLTAGNHTMIPVGITDEHVRMAMQQIITDGFPQKRKSRKYCILKYNQHFPPKYTIALAHEFVTGDFLGSEQFSGGDESERFLQNLGFSITVCDCGGYNRNIGSVHMTQQNISQQNKGINDNLIHGVGSNTNTYITPVQSSMGEQ